MPQKPKYNLPDINSDNNVGQNIARIRKQHGLSQNELSKKVGITQSLLSHYEIGRLNIPVDVVIQIIKALKVDSNVVLGLKEENVDNGLSDLKITSRMKKIQELSDWKRRSIFEMIDAYLEANKS